MKIQTEGFSPSFEDHGRGIPLLLIHGFPLNREMWRPQIEDLSDIAHIIAPDLRGHGRSSAPPGPYSMDQLADDCAALVDHLNLDQPVVVCGLSMGGYVAMAFCCLHANRMAGLILVSTRADSDTPEVMQNRQHSADLARTEGVVPIIQNMLPKLMSPKTYQENPDLVEEVLGIMAKTSIEGIVGAQLGMKDRPDSIETLRQFKLPALLIHGEDDQIVPKQDVEAMKAALDQSEMHIIPAAGHLPNLEQPQLFNQIVRDFLRKFKAR